MIGGIIAFGTPGALEILIILIVLGILLVLAVTFAKHILQSNKERIRLRLEVGKLADELEQIRKKKGSDQGNSSDKSS